MNQDGAPEQVRWLNGTAGTLFVTRRLRTRLLIQEPSRIAAFEIYWPFWRKTSR
jgi:hypothetical protein